MSTLCLVPHQTLAQKWRQSSLREDGELRPFSIAGLVSSLLKDEGIPYRENRLLEQLTIGEVIGQHQQDLTCFAPLVNFPGFMQDLHRLFGEISAQPSLLDKVVPQYSAEIQLLYTAYYKRLLSLGVWDQTTQLRKAIDCWPSSRLRQTVNQIELYYLGELNSLEQEFLALLCQDVPVVPKEFASSAAVVSLSVAKSPEDEVRAIAKQLHAVLAAGGEPNDYAVVFPQLAIYLPIIMPVFSEYQIPWTTPTPSLAHVPIGKSIVTLLQASLTNWPKVTLGQLTIPGWGLPFVLDQQARRAWKLAPGVSGLAAWQELLTAHTGWSDVLGLLQQVKRNQKPLPCSTHVANVLQLLETFNPHRWPASSEQQMGTHLLAWDGIQQICQGLSLSEQLLSYPQFVTMFQTACSNYILPQTRSFHQRVSVSSLESAVGMGYKTLYIAGMIEGAFPKPAIRDWLTMEVTNTNSQKLYDQLCLSARKVEVSYPLADFEGKPNIASPLFNPNDLASKAMDVPRISPLLQRGVQPVVLVDTSIRDLIRRLLLSRQLSVSRLNLYLDCPYRFFCSQILQLAVDEVSDDEITASQEGQLLHEALRRFWQQEAKTPITEILTNCYQEAGQFLTRRVVRMLTAFNQKDTKLVINSGYRPTHLEYPFRDIKVETDYGTVSLHGVIDRIDQNRDGNYIIYDYKLGKNPTTKEVLAGENLQLQVYLLAAEQFLQGDVVGLSFYCIKDGARNGVWYEDTHRDVGLTRRNAGILPADEWNTLQDVFMQTVQRYLHRIFAGEFPIAPRKPEVCTYCPYSSICRKEGCG